MGVRLADATRQLRMAAGRRGQRARAPTTRLLDPDGAADRGGAMVPHAAIEGRSQRWHLESAASRHSCVDCLARVVASMVTHTLGGQKLHEEDVKGAPQQVAEVGVVG